MTLKELLEELAVRLELGDIMLEDDGGAQIVLDDDRVVDVHGHEGRPGFTFSAAVAPSPEEGRETVFAELLEANLMGEGTFGATLALDPTASEIVLCRSINHSDVPYEVFEAELAQFSAALIAWQDRDEDGELGTAAAEAREADHPPHEADPQAGMMRV